MRLPSHPRLPAAPSPPLLTRAQSVTNATHSGIPPASTKLDVGKVPDMRAVAELYHLLQKLEGGVSLLVFCMQKPKSTWVAARQNWELFKHIICQNKVPTVVAITHLEQEEDVDAWWAENNWVFAKHGVIPSDDIHRDYEEAAPWVEANEQAEQARPKVRGVACITASRGRRLGGGRHMLQEQYDESIWKVKKLIYESHLETPWTVKEVSWFQETTRQVKTGHWMCPHYVDEVEESPGQGAYSLMERWGLTYEGARAVIGAIKAGVTEYL
ncbi:hypothetical protein FA13DRAFT_112006 [Coprinellus micaceus]|uniref:Uncharacterized protein n=1 Tax=Coprinellus micaceus TaxID=71717 RepID=A0A4Y7THW0_COPMI|nr:hypothetical protein FA13DRAFT_112006 [Coprinellus micaceus]